MSKKVKIILLFLGLFLLLAATHSVLAQNFGTNEVSVGLNNSLGTTDPRVIVGHIIQILLSLLGVITLILVIYAGFLWMTSGGEEDKVRQAQKILSNAVIGLVIILSAWAITSFVLDKLSQATGAGGASFDNGSNSGFSGQGVGAIGACSVETNYPSDGQKDVPRNTSILITFKEALKLDSVCSDGSGATCACNTTTCNKINPGAIRIFKKDLGDDCSKGICLNPNSNVTDVVVNVTDSNKTLILTPSAPLGSPSANTDYSVEFSNQLKKIDGNSMFKTCGSDFFEYSFTVNTSLDLTPPQVSKGGIFPLPDNSADTQTSVAGNAAQATISFSGSSCPNVYTPAKLISAKSDNPNVTEIPSVTGILSKTITSFSLSVPDGATNTVQLFNESTQEPLGSATFDNNGLAVFPGFFSFQVKSHDPGSKWTVVVQPEIFSDTLTVGQEQYTFVSASDPSAAYSTYISVPAGCSLSGLMSNIQAKLSGNTDIAITTASNTLILTARQAGTNGNDCTLSSTGDALVIKPFNGGVDPGITPIPLGGQYDRPMNTALQINFDKPIDPITVSGSADEVFNYIRIVNANASSSLDKVACSVDSDCRSYKCENKVCIGNYLGGKFMVSNQYRTLEFITDRECGVNACGEKIYCFPANSHLSVELMAANLKTCTSSNDCLSLGSFNTCSSTSLGYSTCQDSNGKNYPLARLDNLDGIVDTAINSLDGNRDGSADGPLSFYYENNNQDLAKKDKYKWSFYIGGKINLTPPQITSISQAQGATKVNLADPISINFNTLMLSSSLHTGTSVISDGAKSVTHKSINLNSSSPTPLGYWISSENTDTNADGEPDFTTVKINHSVFSPSMNYKAQIGSGVKDIDQNCFKPSADQTCGVSPEQSSCCFGTATSDLDADGNCK